MTLIILVGLIWANLFYINLNPAGGDFFPRWLGTRLFLTQGANPYSAETTAEIRRAQQAGGLAPDQADSLFLYPFPAFLLYSPFALTANQVAARTAWMTLLELALFAVLALSLNLSRWRTPAWAVVLLSLFTITWYFALRPVLDGNLVVFTALFILLAMVATRADQDSLAGFLLALSLVKPGPTWLLALFVLIWATAARRWNLVGTFLGSLLLISAAASLLIPDWLVQNIRQGVEYLRIPQTNTPGSLVFFWLPGIGRQFGWLLTIVTLVLLAWEWYQAIGKDFRWFYWTACLTLAVTPLVGLPAALDHYILMLPGLVLVLATWDERWGKVGKLMVALSLILLSFGVWWLALYPASKGMLADQNPWLFLSLPFFMLAGLYWVRWYAIRPPRLPVNELADRF